MQAARAQVDLMTAMCTARGFGDVTPALFLLMSLLDPGGTRSSTLAERAGVSRQAMSKLVRLMEEHCYLEQVGDLADTRAKVVRRRGAATRSSVSATRSRPRWIASSSRRSANAAPRIFSASSRW